MDYLRTLGSAAASSILAKSGITLPFSLGNKVEALEGKTIWTLYDATKRDDSSPVSVFVFDANASGKRNLLPLAKNALRKLRTTRHPDVLRFIEVVETDTTISIVTERVQPLRAALDAWKGKQAAAREEWLIWGLHRIAIALAFINDSCQSTHGNLQVESIFVSPSGEWKLGGLELMTNPKDEAAVLYTFGSLLPGVNSISSPEVKADGWSAAKDVPSALDSYEFGILLHSVFNPSQSLPPTTIPPHPAPTPASRGAIPTSIFPSFKRLLTPKPRPRLSPKAFLEIGVAEKAAEGSGFFSNNRLVQVTASLEGFNVASEGDKANTLRMLKDSADSFPPEFTARKVLPSIVSALEFGGAAANTIIPLVLHLGKAVPAESYSSLVLKHIIAQFASPDRGTRMALLDSLPEYADKLDQKTATEKIWPHLQTGFLDTVAVIREATIRAISLIQPHLSDRVLNNDLLRHLAKAQLDPEASIRTNTCILIGRLAPKLAKSTQRKVLVPAFGRALKDGFMPARSAALMALMATVECYDPEDMASKVIPVISPTLVDKEKAVRDQAFKAMELFVKRLEAHVATMPETANPGSTNTVNGGAYPSAPASTQTAIVNSATGAAGALAGWAMSSLGRTLATSDLQTRMVSAVGQAMISQSQPGSGAPPPPRPQASALTGLPNSSASLSAPSVTTLKNSTTSSSSGSTPTRGMQLGASKLPLSSQAKIVSLSEELAKEAEEEIGDAWGDEEVGEGDLMDVTADAGDWGTFESAPNASVFLAADTEGDGDAWGDLLDADSSTPKPSTPSIPINTKPTLLPSVNVTSKPRTPSASQPSTRPTSVASPPPQSIPGGWGENLSDSGSGAATPTSASRALSPSPAPSSAPGSMAGMTKEEKAAEMARRREERKQRIAALKEGKKTVIPNLD